MVVLRREETGDEERFYTREAGSSRRTPRVRCQINFRLSVDHASLIDAKQNLDLCTFSYVAYLREGACPSAFS